MADLVAGAGPDRQEGRGLLVVRALARGATPVEGRRVGAGRQGLAGLEGRRAPRWPSPARRCRAPPRRRRHGRAPCPRPSAAGRWPGARSGRARASGWRRSRGPARRSPAPSRSAGRRRARCPTGAMTGPPQVSARTAKPTTRATRERREQALRGGEHVAALPGQRLPEGHDQQERDRQRHEGRS